MLNGTAFNLPLSLVEQCERFFFLLAAKWSSNTKLRTKSGLALIFFHISDFKAGCE